MNRIKLSAVIVLALTITATTRAGQIVPWDTFSDPDSNSICDVINAANAELVVLTETQELVLVTGRDVIIDGSEVDIDGNVFINNQPVGFITFQEDDDGFRTLWWVTLNGEVVETDPFTGEPSPSGTFPGEYSDVPCDVCAFDFWDDDSVCVDTRPPPPPTTIRICGNNVVVSMIGSLLGLMTLRLRSRRYL